VKTASGKRMKATTLPGGLIVGTEADKVPFVVVTYPDRMFVVSQIVEPNSYVRFEIRDSSGGAVKGSKSRVARVLAAWDATARAEGLRRTQMLNLSDDPAFDLPKAR